MPNPLDLDLMSPDSSDSFGVTLTGTFRTASFGGEKLEHSAAPVAKTGLKLGQP